MKKYLLAALVIAGAAIGTANAQTLSAPANRTTDRTRVERTVTPLTPRSVGALPRAAHGNPAQMVNPAAPQRYYAPPDETVSGEDPQRARNAGAESNHFRHTGVILFGLRF